MGTRALTRVFDGDKEILCIYRQCDGYVSAHGVEVADFIASRPFVNGMSGSREVFNGMGCFAAQLVKSLKEEGGNVYIKAPGTSDVGEEYVYEIRGGLSKDDYKPLPVTVKCSDTYGGGNVLYEGDIPGFVAFCHTPESEDA